MTKTFAQHIYYFRCRDFIIIIGYVYNWSKIIQEILAVIQIFFKGLLFIVQVSNSVAIGKYMQVYTMYMCVD